MGVTELWSTLEPARESVPLYSLTGKTLAVDLSLWVCEAQQIQAMMGKVHKPHLRNLFFRVSSLTLMGVKLVFVMEGVAPKLKADTMSKRTEMRFGGFQKKAPKPAAAKSTSRGRFNAVLRECGEMLDCLGVPWVTAAGEAEAMCAFLDLHGFVDGCITNDGDAFLYGAQTVYKNFNMNSKDPQVDCYKMAKVQEKLHLSRETLVGFAMLLGCDYIPKGVPGVGKELALKLIQSLNGKSLLQKFREWAAAGVQAQEMAVKKVPHCNVCHHPGSAKAHERNGCTLCDSTHFCQPQDYDVLCPCDWHRSERLRQANATEFTVRKKTLACERFPFTEIIEEFLVDKDKPIQPLRKRKPNLLSMQNFALDKMEWPKHYTSEKVLTLMTYTELMNKRHGRDTLSQIEPIRIYKPRVRNGISCFEVIWKKPEHYVFPEDQETEDQDVVRTVEEEALFRVAYPDIVDLYMKQKEEAEENKNKKKKPRSKKEKSPDVCDDDMSDLLARMSLKNTPTESTTSSTTAVPAKPAEKLSKEPCTEGNQDGCKKDTVNQLTVKPNAEKPLRSPLPGPASPAVTSLSTSTVMDKLHLSDIDWEACSFTTSPSRAASSSKIDQESAERVDTEASGSESGGSVSDSGSQVSPVSNRTELLSENEPGSLRERLLMRNALKSLSSCSERTECVNLTTDRSSEAQSVPLKRAESTVVSGHSKADTGHSGTEKSRSVLPQSQAQAQSKKPAQLHLSHKAAGGCNSEISTIKAATTSTTAHKAKQPHVGSTNPSAKYKFVKTNKEYAPALLQQPNSDDLTSRKQPKGPDPKLRKVSKPSVCVGLVYSSDDSDVENQPKRGQQWNKANKAKSKPIHPRVVHNHIPTAAKIASAAKTASAPKQKPLSVTDPRSDAIPDVSLSERVRQSQRAEVEVIDLCLSAPASPLSAAPSENDDSVISIESPLPLAERLKLKFVK